ncbi:MAG: hypothetical protein M3R02_26620 [Chloroflexota bacterium]|nr:hypothetical protein [Chloroflexota bacterium]
MSAAAILADLRTRDVRLHVEGDQLRARFKGRTLDPDLATIIRAHKPALIAHLQEEETAVTWRLHAMQQQIPERGPIPFVVAVSGIPPAPNTCPSCGEPFTPIGYTPRCPRCTVAAQRALGQPASAPSAPRGEQPEERSSLDMFMAPYPDQVPRAS